MTKLKYAVSDGIFPIKEIEEGINSVKREIPKHSRGFCRLRYHGKLKKQINIKK